jgi:thiosulfate sulfurtransferase
MFSTPQIEASKVKELVESGDAIFLDIRDPMSYAQGHIPNAISVNNQNVQKILEESDKSKYHIIVCYHGNDSQSAALFFKQKGFEKAYSMMGGMAGWRMQYPELLETH